MLNKPHKKSLSGQLFLLRFSPNIEIIVYWHCNHISQKQTCSPKHFLVLSNSIISKDIFDVDKNQDEHQNNGEEMEWKNQQKASRHFLRWPARERCKNLREDKDEEKDHVEYGPHSCNSQNNLFRFRHIFKLFTLMFTHIKSRPAFFMYYSIRIKKFSSPKVKI